MSICFVHISSNTLRLMLHHATPDPKACYMYKPPSLSLFLSLTASHMSKFTIPSPNSRSHRKKTFTYKLFFKNSRNENIINCLIAHLLFLFTFCVKKMKKNTPKQFSSPDSRCAFDNSVLQVLSIRGLLASSVFLLLYLFHFGWF